MTDQQPETSPDDDASGAMPAEPADDAIAADPTTAPTAEAAQPPSPESFPPPAAADAVPGSTPGWYPDPDGTRPDIVRYWDGSAWTDQWSQAEQAKATYGDRYRRRLPLTILVLGLLNILTGAGRLFSPPLFPTSSSLVVVLAISGIIGVFVSGAMWNLVVAAFPGKPRSALPKPRIPKPWIWATLAAIVAGPVFSWSLYRPATVASVTISSPQEACTQFLAVYLDAAKAHTKVVNMAPYFQSLADASRTSDPTFSSTVQQVADSPSVESLKTATSSVLDRCVSEGSITRDQVATWVDQLKAIGS